MAVIWIASHCSEDRFVYLRQAIESCLALKTTEQVVLSIDADFDISALSEFPNLVIKKRDKPLKQFEHLELLVRESNYSDDRWITFCDDDDLLLPETAKYYRDDWKCFIGHQYITVDRSTNQAIPDAARSATPTNMLDIIGRHRDILLEDTDFTGTSARYSLIKEYFKQRNPKKVILPLEDCALMKFLEARGAQPTDHPFVFRRFFGERPIWQDQVVDIIGDLLVRLDKYTKK